VHQSRLSRARCAFSPLPQAKISRTSRRRDGLKTARYGASQVVSLVWLVLKKKASQLQSVALMTLKSCAIKHGIAQPWTTWNRASSPGNPVACRRFPALNEMIDPIDHAIEILPPICPKRSPLRWPWLKGVLCSRCNSGGVDRASRSSLPVVAIGCVFGTLACRADKRLSEIDCDIWSGIGKGPCRCDPPRLGGLVALTPRSSCDIRICHITGKASVTQRRSINGWQGLQLDRKR